MTGHSTATHRVHLEVHEFAAGQRDHHLTLVHRALDDRLLARRLPLVHSLVGADVSDPVRIDLQRRAQLSVSAERIGGADLNTDHSHFK